MFEDSFAQKVWPFDSAAAEAYAEIIADRRAPADISSRPI